MKTDVTGGRISLEPCMATAIGGMGRQIPNQIVEYQDGILSENNEGIVNAISRLQ